MPRTRLSRETLLPRLAGHVLEHGLAGLSLRPLAKAADTSDRMLIYHFGSKDALVAALLEHLSELYSAALDEAFPKEPPPTRENCVREVLAIARQPFFAPFMRIWWDIVAGASKGNAAYRDAAQAMMRRQLDWFEAHMPPGDPDPGGAARLLFTLVEGSVMLDALELGGIADDGIAAARL